MDATEMVAGGWLCGKDGVGRGDSVGGVGCSG